ncbi:MAG TPA: hypothetical protein VLL08_03895 [Kineosporiaceae bacterium]|jgi:hypothetical protein|nr:hypothetical protein [Kineosporiaceae bacterium]
MFTLFFLGCVLTTVVLIGSSITTVLRDQRASKEISREGEDFLARWRS